MVVKESMTKGVVIPNRVYVQGLTPATTESELVELFKEYGRIKKVFLLRNNLGVSKRCSFVTFETEEDAKRLLDDKGKFSEKNIKICPAIRKKRFQNRTARQCPTDRVEYETHEETYSHQSAAFFGVVALPGGYYQPYPHYYPYNDEYYDDDSSSSSSSFDEDEPTPEFDNYTYPPFYDRAWYPPQFFGAMMCVNKFTYTSKTSKTWGRRKRQ